jgi:hypothetical protein
MIIILIKIAGRFKVVPEQPIFLKINFVFIKK